MKNKENAVALSVRFLIENNALFLGSIAEASPILDKMGARIYKEPRQGGHILKAMLVLGAEQNEKEVKSGNLTEMLEKTILREMSNQVDQVFDSLPPQNVEYFVELYPHNEKVLELKHSGVVSLPSGDINLLEENKVAYVVIATLVVKTVKKENNGQGTPVFVVS